MARGLNLVKAAVGNGSCDASTEVASAYVGVVRSWLVGCVEKV